MTVRTKAEHNNNVNVWYRLPKGAETEPKRARRVLVIFGGRNCEGKAEVEGKLGWAAWADRNDVVLVAPGFKDDAYWHPEKWSGAALLSALDEIAKRHPIRTDSLLYYGYSAGSQASNLFAAWRPNLCRAWVSHACGVFHEPSKRMKGVPGLVTCGDADAARNIISRAFVADAVAAGERVVWKSFPNHPHDVPSGSVALARAFLTHWHRSRDGGAAPFVGDESEGVFYPAGSAHARNIPAEDRVALPSLAVAAAWGRAGGDIKRETVTVGGVPFVLRVPETFSNRSRIVVVFGGRGWTGEETLARVGFDGTADTCGFFLLSPSFRDGEYWRPETGTGRVLMSVVDRVRGFYDLERSPLVLYGYSAGGQCAALFAEQLGREAAAWGAHACGVYPETVPSARHALITCGTDDADRFRISRDFVYAAREDGVSVLFRPYPAGHELTEPALALARAWLAVQTGTIPGPLRRWGEDDTFQIADGAAIDSEFRNPLYSADIQSAWLRRE